MKLVITSSKNSEHFYIQQSFINSYGKSTSKTIRKLGSLADLSSKLNTDRDGVIKWCKEQVAIETQKYNDDNDRILVPLYPSQIIDKNKTLSFNCGYLFLQSICSSLRLDNICRNIKNKYSFQYDLEAILSDLIYARILNPSSKLSSYSYCQSFLEKPKYELHDVYRALQVLSSEMDYIQSELYRNSQFIHKRNTSVLYYDCTNYFFEIEQEKDDRKYGKSKENRPNPIVGMGLFMDGDGFPLSFSIYPGNQNEQLTLKPLEEKVIQDFGCTKFIYCSDSGLGSKNNKKFNNLSDKAYVITQSLKKLKKEDKDTALNPKQFRKLGSDKFIDINTLDENDDDVINSIYYKEIPLETADLSETLIVTYSVKYKKYQRSIRDNQIERAKKSIAENGKLKKNRHNLNDPMRFIKQNSVTEDGEIANDRQCYIDYDIVNEEERYNGFYAVSTNLEGDVQEIININKRRWQIEECFRIMKTEFKARPVYVSRQDSIQAHFLTCFIALLVYRILEKKLNYKYTVQEIMGTLKSMNLTLIENAGYIPSYTRKDITDDLHQLFGYRTDYQIMQKSKIRNIIKKSKNDKILL